MDVRRKSRGPKEKKTPLKRTNHEPLAAEGCTAATARLSMSGMVELLETSLARRGFVGPGEVVYASEAYGEY
jgi:hypothetical protein